MDTPGNRPELASRRHRSHCNMMSRRRQLTQLTGLLDDDIVGARSYWSTRRVRKPRPGPPPGMHDPDLVEELL